MAGSARGSGAGTRACASGRKRGARGARAPWRRATTSHGGADQDTAEFLQLEAWISRAGARAGTATGRLVCAVLVSRGRLRHQARGTPSPPPSACATECVVPRAVASAGLRVGVNSVGAGKSESGCALQSCIEPSGTCKTGTCIFRVGRTREGGVGAHGHGHGHGLTWHSELLSNLQNHCGPEHAARCIQHSMVSGRPSGVQPQAFTVPDQAGAPRLQGSVHTHALTTWHRAHTLSSRAAVFTRLPVLRLFSDLLKTRRSLPTPGLPLQVGLQRRSFQPCRPETGSRDLSSIVTPSG